MEAEGKVIRVDGETAVVQVIRKGACGDNCAHCSGCGADTMEVPACCFMDVLPGDWVRISSSNRSVFLGLFTLFILPLVLPLTAYFFAAGSGLEVVAAVFSLLISLALIWYLNKSAWFQRLSKPQVIEVILKARENNE